MDSSGGLDIVVIGLTLTSSWGNRHAVTYRPLIPALSRRGHRICFLERDVPWYADNRDLHTWPFCQIQLYGSVAELKERFASRIRSADAVLVGSYVPDGIEIGHWVNRTASGLTAFYDIDTPVTMAALARGTCEYLTPELIAGFDLYLSFTGGPFLSRIKEQHKLSAVMPLYCSADPDTYRPCQVCREYDLGYMGTYSADRQPHLDRLMIQAARLWPAGRFVLAGQQYPDHIHWPENIHRIKHMPPVRHRDFYNSQRFTLNLTRADMVETGYSPSVRLFEAAACGTPIISDYWPGLENFFVPGAEILISHEPEQTLEFLHDMSENQRRTIGENARRRILSAHTPDHRARALEQQIKELIGQQGASGPG